MTPVFCLSASVCPVWQVLPANSLILFEEGGGALLVLSSQGEGAGVVVSPQVQVRRQWRWRVPDACCLLQLHLHAHWLQPSSVTYPHCPVVCNLPVCCCLLVMSNLLNMATSYRHVALTCHTCLSHCRLRCAMLGDAALDFITHFFTDVACRWYWKPNLGLRVQSSAADTA